MNFKTVPIPKFCKEMLFFPVEGCALPGICAYKDRETTELFVRRKSFDEMI